MLILYITYASLKYKKTHYTSDLTACLSKEPSDFCCGAAYRLVD